MPHMGSEGTNPDSALAKVRQEKVQLRDEPKEEDSKKEEKKKITKGCIQERVIRQKLEKCIVRNVLTDTHIVFKKYGISIINKLINSLQIDRYVS